MPFLLFWMIVGIWQLVFNTFSLTIATDKPIVVLICWLGWVLSRFLNLFLLVVLLWTFLMPLRMIVMVCYSTGFVLLVSWFLYIWFFPKKKKKKKKVKTRTIYKIRIYCETNQWEGLKLHFRFK